MIEVLFGESEAGAMKMAKNYRKPDFDDGATAYFGKKPSKDELEKELSSCKIQYFTSNWVNLKEEKSTLRAIVNGKVIGVPEDFYDHLIRKEIPDGEFIMGLLIGEILGKHPLGVGDWWYAKRINKMIEERELMVVQEKRKHIVKYLKRYKGYLKTSMY